MVSLLRPTLLAEATSLAREHDWDAKFVSGGTAVVLMLQQGLIAPSYLVYLNDLADVGGWRDIAETGEGLRIGGGVRLGDVARSESVRRLAPSLALAASVVGNVRIRNAATLGGNVAEADYASDPPAVLVALGASIEVSDGASTRTIPAADVFTDFFTTSLGTGELVTAIRVPHPGSARSSYTKFCSRSAEDRPCVGVAASLALSDGSVSRLAVALGAVAGTPVQELDICRRVLGRPAEASLFAEIAEAYAAAVDPIDDARGTAWYRRELIRVLVRRSLADLATTAGGGAR
jgi:carbon-monoxide dehydrogenase medium subunit